MNQVQARTRLVQAGAAFMAAALIAGCGSAYRAVITPVTPTGPASQPTSYVAAVAVPSATAAGVASLIDYSGDSLMASAKVGVDPLMMALDENGSELYTYNGDGTLTNITLSTSMQNNQVEFSTLPTTAQPVSMFAPVAGLWVADLAGNSIDVMTGISPASFKLAVPVAATPISVVGAYSGGSYVYAVTQGAVASGLTCTQTPQAGPVGEADSISTSNYTIAAKIPLGVCPSFAISTPDNKRVFVLNRGDDTITVINTAFNALNKCAAGLKNLAGQPYTCHPTLPLSTTAVTNTGITPVNGTTGMNTVAGPVYAEYNAATQQLIVANYDGSSISIIDVSLDQYGNDSQTFGTTYTVAVGKNPASVTVLYDGSRAYTANQKDGTVSVVNLTSHTLKGADIAVMGHPRTIVSTQNSVYGKVYTASPDSPYVTVINTTSDAVTATVLLEGNVLDVRTTTQNASSINDAQTSRLPGYGQPCNTPLAGTGYTLAQCQSMTAPKVN